MLDGPIGSAAFNNEFGRPGLAGTFRTLLTNVGGEDGESDQAPEWRGYHKPIMVSPRVSHMSLLCHTPPEHRMLPFGHCDQA